MEKLIKRICITAAIAALIALGTFISHFGLGFASNIGNWGAVGDFFGGVLNPTFALLSLILIAYTLMQNKKALDQGALAIKQSELAIQQGTKAIEQNEKALQVSNEELALTRNELANSATALEEQAKLLAVQSFETTFFNMLELHNNILKSIEHNPNKSWKLFYSKFDRGIIAHTENIDSSGSRAIYSLTKQLGSLISNDSTGSNALQVFDIIFAYENQSFGSFFRNLYQVLKLIQSNTNDYETHKKYSNILRAQFSNQELSLLFFNCLSSEVDGGQFKELVIYFKLLEHLNIKYTSTFNIFKITSPDIMLTAELVEKYLVIDESGKLSTSAFGENPQLIQYCKGKGYLN
ncbi:putative phage abortive infection protein [Pseudoalteromonas sp. 20-92]|uniref:putative phage abortive infection protein n=1 Tax=Pseudoalteromonas sp. 20-92 TaxID=2969394 RepID=UPI0027AFAB79|nr:putative phage abortive infection protein [Pseudoalteromonas sp. 20-92]MDQ2045553.1 putative phage abortive infection protein [Pseudoalteromonas sp. 20-92]